MAAAMTMRELLTECQKLFEAGRSHRALLAMDAYLEAGGSPGDDPQVQIKTTVLRARALNRVERFKEALQTIEEVLQRKDVADPEQALAYDLRARLKDRLANAPTRPSGTRGARRTCSSSPDRRRRPWRRPRGGTRARGRSGSPTRC